MSNKDIHIRIMTSGVKKWKIADQIGIVDTTFSKWLRKELPEDKKQLILEAIEKLSQGAKE